MQNVYGAIANRRRAALSERRERTPDRFRVGFWVLRSIGRCHVDDKRDVNIELRMRQQRLYDIADGRTTLFCFTDTATLGCKNVGRGRPWHMAHRTPSCDCLSDRSMAILTANLRSSKLIRSLSWALGKFEASGLKMKVTRLHNT